MNLNYVNQLIRLAQLFHGTMNIAVEITIKQDGPEMAANQQVPDHVLLDVTGLRNEIRIKVDGEYDRCFYEDVQEGINRYVARSEGMLRQGTMEPARASKMRCGIIEILREVL